MKHLGKTRPFRGPEGNVLLESVAEVKYTMVEVVRPLIPVPVGENAPARLPAIA